MRHLLVAAAVLFSSSCIDLEDLIDPDLIDVPDPCETAEIACNGIDEDCDGVDECAELPLGAADGLLVALGLAEHDCGGAMEFLTEALEPLELGLGDCPSATTVDSGPLWDGVTQCEDWDPEEGTCTRSGSAATSTYSGGCRRDDHDVDGGLSIATGTLDTVRVTDQGRVATQILATEFEADVPDGMSLARDDVPAHYRITGEGGRTTAVTWTTDEEDIETSESVDGCSLALGLQSAVPPAPLPPEGGAVQFDVQRRESQASETYIDTRNGNASVQMPVMDGELGMVSLSWVREQDTAVSGGETTCDQTGTIEVWADDLAGTDRFWTVTLQLDEACEPCGELRVDGAYAGLWCDGAPVRL